MSSLLYAQSSGLVPSSGHAEATPAPKAHHATAAAVAAFAGSILLDVAIVGVLGLAGVASFGLLPFAALVTMATVAGLGSMLCFLKAYWASRPIDDPAFVDFKTYVEQKCPGFTLAEANAFADAGKAIIREIQSNKNNGTCNPDRGQEKLIAVSWYFIRRSFETRQGFRKGMIKFEDPDHKIVNFFKPVMKKRLSSHFKTERQEGDLGSLGRDVPKGLPFIFKHVHMGALKTKDNGKSIIKPKNFSFIKLEQYGLSNPMEKVAHGVDLVRSELSKLMGEGNGPSDRKEGHIPKKVQKAFAKLTTAPSSSPKVRAVSRPKVKTVSGMVVSMQDEDDRRKHVFTQVLDTHFPRKNHEHRSGSEALLMQEDLV